MQSISQCKFKQKEISQILPKPDFKAFRQSEKGFQRCGFLYLPLGDFILPLSPGLIGLSINLASKQNCFQTSMVSSG